MAAVMTILPFPHPKSYSFSPFFNLAILSILSTTSNGEGTQQISGLLSKNQTALKFTGMRNLGVRFVGETSLTSTGCFNFSFCCFLGIGSNLGCLVRVFPATTQGQKYVGSCNLN